MTRQFDGFAPPAVHGNPKARQKWAVEQMKFGAKASQQSRAQRARVLLRRARLALTSIRGRSGPAGLIEEAFAELGTALEADPRRL